MPDGKEIKLDPNAKSKIASEPAFLSKPDGAPVYHGFPVVPETETDGWYLGVITDYEDSEGCDYGDAYVVTPEGERAGLVWEVGEFETYVVMKPDSERWGVYGIAFPKVVKNTKDLVECFRIVLPDLKRIYSEVQEKRKRSWLGWLTNRFSGRQSRRRKT